MSNIKIKYKENEYEYESGISLLEISKNFKNDFKEKIKNATIYTKILGSDHCPIGLEIE